MLCFGAFGVQCPGQGLLPALLSHQHNRLLLLKDCALPLIFSIDIGTISQTEPVPWC